MTECIASRVPREASAHTYVVLASTCTSLPVVNGTLSKTPRQDQYAATTRSQVRATIQVVLHTTDRDQSSFSMAFIRDLERPGWTCPPASHDLTRRTGLEGTATLPRDDAGMLNRCWLKFTINIASRACHRSFQRETESKTAGNPKGTALSSYAVSVNHL
jgi:hypothetical protein